MIDKFSNDWIFHSDKLYLIKIFFSLVAVQVAKQQLRHLLFSKPKAVLVDDSR